MIVSLIIVTRGNVPIAPLIEQDFPEPFKEIIVWDNSKRLNLSVYGRYAAIAEAKGDVIAVQDDDCIVPWTDLLGEYIPGERLCNMSRHRWPDYPDSSLLGWGALFPRDAPAKAFQRAPLLEYGLFLRTCDVVFTALMPFRRVDVGHQDMDYANAPDRMWTGDPDHVESRQEVLRACLSA